MDQCLSPFRYGEAFVQHRRAGKGWCIRSSSQLRSPPRQGHRGVVLFGFRVKAAGLGDTERRKPLVSKLVGADETVFSTSGSRVKAHSIRLTANIGNSQSSTG